MSCGQTRQVVALSGVLNSILFLIFQCLNLYTTKKMIIERLSVVNYIVPRALICVVNVQRKILL